MSATERIRTLFTPKRGAWQGALFGLLLGLIHSWVMAGPVVRAAAATGGRCNLFQLAYFLAFAVIGKLAGWPGTVAGAWEIEVLTLGFFAGLYAIVWAMLKGRYFWIGFALLWLTLLLLGYPVRRCPFI